MNRMESKYSVEHVDGGSKFTVLPAKGGRVAIIFLAVLLVFITAQIAGGVLGALSLVAMPLLLILPKVVLTAVSFVMSAVLVYVWYRLFQFFRARLHRWEAKNRHAFEKSFLVTGSHIELDEGAKFKFTEITRMSIRNSKDGSVNIPMTGYIVGGSATTVAVGTAAAALTNSLALLINLAEQKTASIGYALVLESGGNAHVIAGGLTEICVHGLAADIARLSEQHAKTLT